MHSDECLRDILAQPRTVLRQSGHGAPLDAGISGDYTRLLGGEMLRVSDRDLCRIQLEDKDGIAERIVAVFERDGKPVTY